MNLTPIYNAFITFTNGVIPFVSLFLCWWFLRAYLHHRGQPAFLIYSIGAFCWAVVSGYHLASYLKRLLGTEIFPFVVWRTLAYLFFVLDPIATVCAVWGSIVLVRTYGRPSTPSK